MTADGGRATNPPLGKRVALALLVVFAAVSILSYDSVARPDAVPDFDHVWFAARAILEGRDPYQLVGPGREYNWPWLLYYPLTAPTSILPLALLPLTIARALYVAIPVGLLAFLLARGVGLERGVEELFFEEFVLGDLSGQHLQQFGSRFGRARGGLFSAFQ